MSDKQENGVKRSEKWRSGKQEVEGSGSSWREFLRLIDGVEESDNQDTGVEQECPDCGETLERHTATNDYGWPSHPVWTCPSCGEEKSRARVKNHNGKQSTEV